MCRAWGAIDCFFRDHPDNYWAGASWASGNSHSVPGVPAQAMPGQAACRVLPTAPDLSWD